MKDFRIFQVKINWTVFRILIDYTNQLYPVLKEWLQDNCVGTYKIFNIDSGHIGNNYKYGDGEYGPLV